MHVKRNEYAQMATATYISVHSGGIEDSGKGNLIADLTEPFPKQRVNNMVGSARASAE